MQVPLLDLKAQYATIKDEVLEKINEVLDTQRCIGGPMVEELEACGDYLERQIQSINPKVIVTLGRFSMARFLPNAKISAVHGQAVQVRGRLIVPMYHPAAALHQGSLRPVIERDFAQLPELIAGASAAPDYTAQASPEDKQDPEQLSFF